MVEHGWHWGQIDGLNALFTLISVVITSVVVLSRARVVSDNKYRQAIDDLQDIAAVKDAQITTLMGQMAERDTQLREIRDRVSRIETENDRLTRAYVALDLRREYLESLLTKAGMPVPPKVGI